MKALNVFLAVVVSLAITLLVLEGGLRLIGKGPQVTVNQPDEWTGWSKRKNFSFRRKTSEFDVRIETNSLGLRDDETSKTKPANTFRVLCLGDSFVLGYAVPREQLFVDMLEQWWRAEERAVEVLNVGTEAWSTDQEAAWLEQNAADYRPDVVLLFPYENDLWWNGEREYGGTAKPTYDASGKLEREHLVQRPVAWYERTALGRLL